MRRLILVALTSVLVACGAAGGQCSASLTGKPTVWQMDDGVRCYTYTSGSISCVQVPR